MATDITDRKRREEAFSAAALAVSQSEEETLYRQLARYLAADPRRRRRVHRDDGARRRPARLRMLAFHLDGEVARELQLPDRRHALRDGRRPAIPPVSRRGCSSSFRSTPTSANSGLEMLRRAPARRCGRPAARPDRRRLAPAVQGPGAGRGDAEDLRGAGQCRARTRRGGRGAARLGGQLPADLRGLRRRDLRARLGHAARSSTSIRAPARAYGYTRDELLRLTCSELSAGEPPYTEVEALRWIEQAKREGSASFEWRRRSKDGSLHWDEVRLKRAEIGGRLRILAFTREITERKRAEEALRASEEQYRAIFNASSDALVLLDSRFRRVDVNPAFESMYGWTRDEVLGRGYDEAAHQPDYEAHPLRADPPCAGRRDRPGRARGRPQERRAHADRGRDDPVPAPRRAARARDRARHHRAQAGRGGPAHQRGAVPGGVQRVRRRAGAVELAVRARRRQSRLRAHVRLHRDEVLAGVRTRDLPDGIPPTAIEIIMRTLAGKQLPRRNRDLAAGRASTSRSRCARSRSRTAASRMCSRSSAT